MFIDFFFAFFKLWTNFFFSSSWRKKKHVCETKFQLIDTNWHRTFCHACKLTWMEKKVVNVEIRASLKHLHGSKCVPSVTHCNEYNTGKGFPYKRIHGKWLKRSKLYAHFHTFSWYNLKHISAWMFQMIVAWYFHHLRRETETFQQQQKNNYKITHTK